MLQTYWEAVLLGVVQGLTEFLPVSSSGHLAIAQSLLELEADAPSMLLFDVFAHVATLLAVMIVFRDSFRRFFVRLLHDMRGFSAANGGRAARPRLHRAVAVRVTLLGITASVPTAYIGLVFEEELEQAFGEPTYIAAALVVTGTLLLVTSRLARGRRGWRRFGFPAAFGVGVAQGMAIMPGISRSGATICAAMLFGLRRRWAAEFSFFIAVPAILGATGLKLLQQITALGSEQLAGLPIGPVAAGCAAAFLTGLAALRMLLAAVQRASLGPFTWYCYAAAAAILFATLIDRL